jgi:hemoglobin
MNIPRVVSLRSTLVLAASLAIVACASQTPSTPQTKLYDRLGGMPAIKAVVTKTIDNAAADPRTSRSFKGIKLDEIKESVANQVCEATGGPCKYDGPSMAKVHEGLDITSAEFDAFAGILVGVLDEFKVGSAEKNELVQILAPMKKDIVTK